MATAGIVCGAVPLVLIAVVLLVVAGMAVVAAVSSPRTGRFTGDLDAARRRAGCTGPHRLDPTGRPAALAAGGR